ncbi:hypothetical protein C3K47_02930 [Solitalea longa]|uniref:TPM domain-containing protein n=1 Tax=Solitalea longa TaxID=2079460 RepID=A0A2S5A709_9SPHI|nr:TPM domain-containing protein [Solitalea longa]POY38368.1 hypothetical protein C3K47_02930 [Solitalea longa]
MKIKLLRSARLALLLFITTLKVYGQDSFFVSETCKQIQALKNKDDVEEQLKIFRQQSEKHGPDQLKNALEKGHVKSPFIFYYKFTRDLDKSCSNYKLGIFPIKALHVIDIENKLTKVETDSLKSLVSEIGKEKKVYLLVTTIDDYYPDTTIKEFCQRNINSWGNGRYFEKDNILIAISLKNRDIYICTTSISMKHLTNEECIEVIQTIKPYLKNNELYNGLANGLIAIKEKL